jgi:hypothetical protein
VAGVLDPLPIGGTERVARDEGCRGNDVHAGREDPHELVEVRELRVVDDAIGLQRKESVHVVGGEHARRFDAGELAGVHADLVRAPCVATHELELRARQHGLHGPAADVARRPLHHASCHQMILFWSVKRLRRSC